MSFIFANFLRPAVSTSVIVLPCHLSCASIESLVVPAIGVTIDLSFCNRVFVKDDFPTLGIPTIDNLSCEVSDWLLTTLGIFSFSKIESKRSPIYLPLKADIGNGSSSPNS